MLRQSARIASDVTTRIGRSMPQWLRAGSSESAHVIWTSSSPLQLERSVLHALDRSDGYALARCLAFRFEAQALIDIGSSQAVAPVLPNACWHIRVNLIGNDENSRPTSPDCTWTELDVNFLDALALVDSMIDRSVVFYTGAEHGQRDVRYLLGRFARLVGRALAVVVTVPHRPVALGTGRLPYLAPLDTAPGWTIHQFARCLAKHDLDPTFMGLTPVASADQVQEGLLAIIDHVQLNDGITIPAHFRPLAIVATYNDADIAPQTITKLLNDGFEVHVLDNWSTDGTFERLSALAATRGGLEVERFPDEGPTRYHEFYALLVKKEEIACKHRGRWILHGDSDEIRCSPWADISLRGGLHIVDQMGFTAVNFTVCNFRPVDDQFSPGMDPELHLPYFELTRRANRADQVKLWLQGEERVDLARSAGHRVEFAGRKIFPYNFILKHYPFRSSRQARRKVFAERLERFSPELRARGWHTHYDACKADDPFIWDASQLTRFDDHETRRTHLTELISGIGIMQ